MGRALGSVPGTRKKGKAKGVGKEKGCVCCFSVMLVHKCSFFEILCFNLCPTGDNFENKKIKLLFNVCFLASGGWQEPENPHTQRVSTRT